ERAAAQDFAFRFVRWIAHLDAHQEAIKLRLGKRVSTVVFDWILRGDDQERLRQRMSFPIDGDLRFVHGFEQGGLRARRGAVDFVGQNDVGKKRAGTKLKFARVGLVHADAEHIARQKVGSKLNALKSTMKRFRERLRESGRSYSGDIFDQQVPAGEQCDQRKLNGFFFPVNGA